jgi:ATP-dependent DNA helicase RecQ
LINLGYCEIAFHKQNKIRLTSLAKKVLFEGEKSTTDNGSENQYREAKETKKTNQ